MSDLQKIDSYFDGKNGFEQLSLQLQPKGVSWRRVFKLGFPCLAAALLGVMVVMPNIRKSVDLRDNVTIPRKNEMEKLHIENTVFNSTDSKNRVNKIVAESVDETEAGSKIMKIMRPSGNIPTDNGHINIYSEYGLFNQNNNILDLFDNVKVVVNDDTVITSSEASYDFNKELGWGHKPIHAVGSWGMMDAREFEYDKVAAVLTLKQQNSISTDNGTLSSEEETKIFQNENKSVSVGKATVSEKDNNLYADKIIAYFSDSGKKELIKAEVYGNVIIETLNETASGKEGHYNPATGEVILYGDAEKRERAVIHQGENVLKANKITVYLGERGGKDIKKALADGNVEVLTPNGSAKGDRGIYNPKANIVELFDNVRIEQNGNFIVGDYAETDLLTSISRVTGNKATGDRIHGTFYKTRKVNNASKAKK